MVDSDPLFMYQDPSLCSISLSRQRRRKRSSDRQVGISMKK